MVKGVGVDIIEIERIKKVVDTYERFVSRIFTSNEQNYCLSRPKSELHFAVRFAAKEAAMKALGTGAKGVRWTDFEVGRKEGGQPFISLSGQALEKAKEKGIDEILVSLSFNHSQAIATAVAI